MMLPVYPYIIMYKLLPTIPSSVAFTRFTLAVKHGRDVVLPFGMP